MIIGTTENGQNIFVMSKEETAIFGILLCNISGSPEDSARAITDTWYNKLFIDKIGTPKENFINVDVFKYFKEKVQSGGFYFSDGIYEMPIPY